MIIYTVVMVGYLTNPTALNQVHGEADWVDSDCLTAHTVVILKITAHQKSKITCRKPV